MFTLIFYYLVLPILVLAFFLALSRRSSPNSIPSEVRKFYGRNPIEPKCFRAIRLDGKFGHRNAKLSRLGDFENQPDAVDAAFAAKSRSRSNASFLVLNDKGEVLQEV